MSGDTLQSYAERELNYQVRKEISKQIRNSCPEGDPMVTGATVMLGSILAMAAFSAMLSKNGRGGRMR
jgi:hypothetical protein